MVKDRELARETVKSIDESGSILHDGVTFSGLPPAQRTEVVMQSTSSLSHCLCLLSIPVLLPFVSRVA